MTLRWKEMSTLKAFDGLTFTLPRREKKRKCEEKDGKKEKAKLSNAMEEGHRNKYSFR